MPGSSTARPISTASAVPGALGQQVRVDRLAGAAGDILDLTDVLLLGDEDSTTLGTPTVENAHVVASIVEQVRGRKILVFKYKSKKRYRKLRGHRQRHTDLRIEEIVGPDGASYKHGFSDYLRLRFIAAIRTHMHTNKFAKQHF